MTSPGTQVLVPEDWQSGAAYETVLSSSSERKKDVEEKYGV